MTKRKSYHELDDENRALRVALEDCLDIIIRPGRYHYRLVYTPEAAPLNEHNPPGLTGGRAIINRAKHILGKTHR